MWRFIVGVLLVLVIFLSGMLFGIDREQIAVGEQEPPITKADIAPIAPVKQEVTKVYEPVTVQKEAPNKIYTAEINQDEHYTKKTAAFLETVVLGFYTIVVETLFSIANFLF